MTFVRNIVKDAATGVGVTEAPEGLSAIHRPGCAAAIWHRSSPARFSSWVDALAPELLPKARVVLRPDAIRDTVLEICETSGIPAGAEREHLVDDVAELGDIFSNLVNTKWLRLRLDVITTNACRRFHIDAITARLVCTYRGTGTQFGISTNGCDPSHIYTVPTCSPILLRGTLWPEYPKSGLLHRSPPIEGTGETRLVLVLDPVADPEIEPDHVLTH